MKRFRNLWTPVFTGVTTFYEAVSIRPLNEYLSVSIRKYDNVPSMSLTFAIAHSIRPDPFGSETCRRAVRLRAHGRGAQVESLKADLLMAEGNT